MAGTIYSCSYGKKNEEKFSRFAVSRYPVTPLPAVPLRAFLRTGKKDK